MNNKVYVSNGKEFVSAMEEIFGLHRVKVERRPSVRPVNNEFIHIRFIDGKYNLIFDNNRMRLFVHKAGTYAVDLYKDVDQRPMFAVKAVPIDAVNVGDIILADINEINNSAYYGIRMSDNKYCTLDEDNVYVIDVKIDEPVYKVFQVR